MSKKLESILKQQFQNLLKKISAKANVDEADVDETREYLNMCARSDSWTYAMVLRTKSGEDFVRDLAEIFTLVKEKIEEDHEQRMDVTDEVRDLTFVAHGEVRQPLHPSLLNYMNGHIDSVILYVPWGCCLDASAAWGIATNTITRDRVEYTPPDMVFPDSPSTWNILPKQDNTRIPDVVFTPIQANESVYQELCCISRMIQKPLSGLVLVFEPGTPLPLGEIKLWVLCAAVALSAWIFDLKFRIHIASCLKPSEMDPVSPLFSDEIHPPYLTVDCENYCVVPVDINPSCIMKMELPLTDEQFQIQQHITTINAALGVEQTLPSAVN